MTDETCNLWGGRFAPVRGGLVPLLRCVGCGREIPATAIANSCGASSCGSYGRRMHNNDDFINSLRPRRNDGVDWRTMTKLDWLYPDAEPLPEHFDPLAPTDHIYDDLDCLFCQLVCHAIAAPPRNTWNLDTFRRRGNPYELARSQCNPVQAYVDEC